MRWLTIFAYVGGALLALLLGFATCLYGGIPHGYDRYGVVAVPGRQILELPAGRVMLDHADDVRACWDNTNHVKNASIHSAPEGLAVRVVPMSGAAIALDITRIPVWLYEGDTNCRGHRPFGRIEVPAAGAYLVETTDDDHGGFVGRPDRRGRATPTSTSGPGIAFGAAPWAPLGSRVLAGLVVATVVFLFVWVPVRFWGALRGRLSQ